MKKIGVQLLNSRRKYASGAASSVSTTTSAARSLPRNLQSLLILSLSTAYV